MTDDDVRPLPFESGEEIAFRSIRVFRGHGRRVGFAVGARVLVDEPALRVVATTLGSGLLGRRGKGSGPNARLVLGDDWHGEYDARAWDGAAVVRVHRPGEPWSVWRWHDGTAWERDWYGNLELPWVRVEGGFDSQDWALDVVASGMPGAPDFTVRFKDEDELAFLVEAGEATEEQAAVIRAAGDRLAAVARAGTWPFDADWSDWIPDPAWPAVALPEDVTRLG